MYHVSAQGVDERMINVHDYYYYSKAALDGLNPQTNTGRGRGPRCLVIDWLLIWLTGGPVAGLKGKTSLDGLRVDEVVGLCVDLTDAIYTAKFEKDETKKVGSNRITTSGHYWYDSFVVVVVSFVFWWCCYGHPSVWLAIGRV